MIIFRVLVDWMFRDKLPLPPNFKQLRGYHTGREKR